MTTRMTEACMLAALGATNEAILRAQSQEELFQRVCNAAVHGGGFRNAAALLPESDGSLRYVAFANRDGEPHPENLRTSINEQSEHGQGLVGIAFRSVRSAVCNDILADPRLKPWHEISRRRGVRSSAAVPIVKDDASVGVFLFSLSDAHALTGEIIALIERMVENVSFGIRALERERRMESVSRMFAALSATNEAIIRARTRKELSKLVCEAAALGGTFQCARIAFIEPDREHLRIVAAAGRGKETAIGILIPLDFADPGGRSVGEIAFKSGQPCISNDYLGDPRMTHFRERLREFGTRSVAAFPFLKDGQSVGQFTLQSGEVGTFTTELINLLQRLADNVSFALANFDRADEKKMADARIQYLATHDGLTGLPNRVMFTELLGHSIKSARRNGGKCAVLFIDLDRFKVINDSLGHAAGDALLIEVATRLRACVRESDVVARLGGDEFVAVLDNVTDCDDVATVARKILASLLPATVLAGHECRTTGSIGIAVFPDNGTDADTLTKNADMAMYLAKEEGKNGYRFFSSQIKSQSIERLMLETSLRHALDLNQFAVHY